MSNQRDIDASRDPQFYRQETLGRPYGGNILRRIADTTPRSGLNIFWIQTLSDTVFTTLTDMPGFSSSGVVGATIPAGSVLAGRFSAVTLASGVITTNEL